MKTFVALTIASLAMVAPAAVAQEPSTPQEEVPTALNFTLKTIDGKEKPLSDYRDKVIVVVNVASKCGMTPQYKTLQALHEKYADRGLAVLGFPCNQFGGQEPGSDEEILTFCSDKYGVDFDMFSKIDVNGDDANAFYKHLTSLDLQPKGAGKVGWNFEKFLLDRQGNVIARFGSRTDPMSEEFVAAVEKALDNQ